MPGLETDAAEEVHDGTRKRLRDLYNEDIPNTLIQRLDYVHDGRKFSARVGEEDERNQGVVFAVFGPTPRRRLYYVATYDRGVAHGGPILVGDDEVINVFEFLKS